MTCRQVQTNLSLYLYGELEFAQEEELEQHLQGCAFCQLALSREKAWHTSLQSERKDVPFDLLTQCRRDLRAAVKPSEAKNSGGLLWLSDIFTIFHSGGQWSKRLAFASFFMFAGFYLSGVMNRMQLRIAPGTDNPLHIASLNSPVFRVRDVQPSDNRQVRIVIDRVQEQQVTGSIKDEFVRRLVLAAAKDPADPGLRVDSVQLLNGQDGTDVRDALLRAARYDDNPAVRLKALQGLRGFANDRETHDVLRSVLQYDANPAVRSEAIDVLVPANGPVRVTPELAGTLEDIVRSDGDDDYLRARCLQALQILNTHRLY